MLICGRDSSKGFHNWQVYHHPNYLCGELPNQNHCPYSPYGFLITFCYIYQYARVCLCALAPFPRPSPCLLDNIIGKFSDFTPPIIVGTMIIALYQQISIPHCLIAYGASISSSTVAQSDEMLRLGFLESLTISRQGV